MDAKSEEVMKSSSSTSKSIVQAEQIASSSLSSSVVMQKKAVTSTKILTSDSGNVSGGFSTEKSASDAAAAITGASELSAAMSGLALKEFGGEEGGKYMSDLSSTVQQFQQQQQIQQKESVCLASSTTSSAVRETSSRISSTQVAAEHDQENETAEKIETKVVKTKPTVESENSNASEDVIDGTKIEEVVEEILEEELSSSEDTNASEDAKEEENKETVSGTETTTTTTTLTVVTTKCGTDAVEAEADHVDGGGAITTTTKTITTKKTGTVTEPKLEVKDQSVSVETVPIISTTPPTPEAISTTIKVEEIAVESEVDDEEQDDEEEETEVEESKNVTPAAAAPSLKSVDQTDAEDKENDQAQAHDRNANNKQEVLNNQLKNIISDIDSNIKEQENITQLKQQELELINKQQELAKQIQQQQLLANQLAAQNQLKQQELQQQQQQQLKLSQNQHQQQQQQFLQQSQAPPQQQPQQLISQAKPQTNSSKFESFEETHDENGYTRKSEVFKTEESSSSTSNVSKTIDLRKIFTPATDAQEILPKNRKLYASSAFYSPSLHPTVEDQVELARRISHSLSDISNHTSKGQSMYVNRKKRSVKWIHEGSGQDDDEDDEETITANAEESKENTSRSVGHTILDKLPLRLVMNPRGQMRDYNSVSESMNIETGLLSPDNCAELITALQLQKGRGAELFAKRRRKADNWVVDETNLGTQSPSGLTDYQQYQPRPATSPSMVPAYSDAGKHRVQLNMHQEQMIEKYAKPGLKVVKSPWEAALETGSASAAFVDSKPQSHSSTPALSSAPAPVYVGSATTSPYQPSMPQQQQPIYKLPESHQPHPQYQSHSPRPIPVNPQRDLAYKPNVAQGWKAPGVELPRAHQNGLPYEQQQFVNETGYPKSCDRDLQILGHSLDTMSGTLSAAAQQSSSYCRDEHFWREISKPQQQTISTHSPVSIPIEEIPDTKYVQIEDTLEEQKRVDVQKQLQYLEALQRQVQQQHQQELLIIKRREHERAIRRQRQEKRRQSQQLSAEVPSTSTVKKTSSTSTCTAKQQQHKVSVSVSEEDDDDYVKVAVRDLISSFEQQSLAEQSEQLVKQDLLAERQTNYLEQMSNQAIEASQTPEPELKCIAANEEGMYVPKEIPLDSYAPPPTYSQPQSSYSPSWTPCSAVPAFEQYPQQQQHQQQPCQITTSSSPTGNGYAAPKSVYFPITKPEYTSGFTQPGPPKQQLYAPTSYQKVAPTKTQNSPAVNFNPSPISYDKLSKFENPDAGRDSAGLYSPPQRNLNVVRGSSKVRNASPIPFGGMRSPVSAYGSSPNSFNTASPPAQVYGQALGHFPAPPQSHGHGHSSNYLQGGPSFNTTARGWGSGAGQNLTYPKPAVASAGVLPYSDF